MSTGCAGERWSPPWPVSALPGKRDSRPAGGTTEPAQSISAATKSEASVQGVSPQIVARFKDAYGVLVIGKASRRHVFFGLPAAQRAVDNARARGDYAELVLVRLEPVVGLEVVVDEV